MSRQQQQQLSQSSTVSRAEREMVRGERKGENALYIPQTNSELEAKWQTKLTSTMQKSNSLSFSLFLKPLFSHSLSHSLAHLNILRTISCSPNLRILNVFQCYCFVS